LNIANKWFIKTFVFQIFLFVVFAGEKQPKHGGKCHKLEKILVKDVLFTHIMCCKAKHKQVFCFQRPPTEIVMCRYFAFKGAPTATEICMYSAVKRHQRGP